MMEILEDLAVEPAEFDRVRAAFPDVEFVTVPWRPLDLCGGCPESSLRDPLPSHAVVVYQRSWVDENGETQWGHVYRHQFGQCCLKWELRQLLANPPARLYVEVLAFETKAVA